MRERVDVMIVLGSQIGVRDGIMGLAFHTEMKARAAGIACQSQYANKFILSGGYNFFVRYDLNRDVPVYGSTPDSQKPDFSDSTQKKAKIYRSEASLIAQFMRQEYEAHEEMLILEEDSKTNLENAQFCREIVRRLYQKEKSRLGPYSVGILTLLYHMEKALPLFQNEMKEIKGRNGHKIDIASFFAEDILVKADNSWVGEICSYYKDPKGGKQWDIRKMKKLFEQGKSIAALLKKEEEPKEAL